MPKQSIRYYLLIFFVVLLPLVACSPTYKAARKQRQQERSVEQRRLQGEKALREGKERHMEMQGPDTRKRMKETKRKSDRFNKKREEPFFIRWFTSNKRQ